MTPDARPRIRLPRPALVLLPVLLFLLPVPAPAQDEPGPPEGEPPLQVATADNLVRLFDRLDYTYAEVAAHGAPVPRVFLETLPPDLDGVDSGLVRKRLFIDTLLPLVLRVDEDILRQRVRLLGLRNWAAAGQALSAGETRWLRRLTADCGLDRPDFDGLLACVDVIPPSMALAQAAIETGLGTSRLAREYNALFGQTGQDTIEGYAAFERLQDGVEAYIHNLNTHPAYAVFRALRAERRYRGEPLDGWALMEGLTGYSVRGEDYVADVRRFIEANELRPLDRARLAKPDTQVAARAPL